MIDLDIVRRYRASQNSRADQSSDQKPFPRVFAAIDICKAPRTPEQLASLKLMHTDLNLLPTPMEEIENAPAVWMWDYLRRSGARGFFLPLSGGADSASVAALVACMARIVLKEIQTSNNKKTLTTLRKVVQDANFTPKTY